jgi:hypothetical protein
MKAVELIAMACGAAGTTPVGVEPGQGIHGRGRAGGGAG